MVAAWSISLAHRAAAFRPTLESFRLQHSYYCDECGAELAPWLRRKLQMTSQRFSESINGGFGRGHGHAVTLLTVSRWGRVVDARTFLESRSPKRDAACRVALQLETGPLPAVYPKDFLSLFWVCWYDETPYDISSDGTGEAIRSYLKRVFAEMASDPKSAVHAESIAIALHRAAVAGHVETLQPLLDGGAPPDAPAPGGVTPLMAAVTAGQVDTAEALLERGADVNAEREKGRTALMLASALGDAEMIRVLLTAGAERGARSDNGWTAPSLAELYGRDDVRALLGGTAPGRAGRFDGATIAADASPPHLFEQTPASYTQDALRRHVAGNVALTAVVLADGQVGDLWVRRSLDIGLDLNAVESVRQWRFLPATRDGQPVAQPVDIEIEFSLPALP